METVTHHGRTTAYRHSTSETGPTVCYVHGAGGSHRIWSKQYDENNHPVVVPDLSGHGDSEDVSTKAGVETLAEYADDVVAVCEAADVTVLCGNSMGGAVALWIALERDLDLKGLVLTDSGAKLAVDPVFIDTLASDFEAAIDSLHAPGTFFYNPTDDLVGRSLEGLRAAGREVTLRDFATCDAFDVRGRLDEIEVPTLALCGEHDQLTPPAFHEYLADELPNCTYHEIAEAAHMPMLERPDAFESAIETFLSEER